MSILKLKCSWKPRSRRIWWARFLQDYLNISTTSKTTFQINSLSYLSYISGKPLILKRILYIYNSYLCLFEKFSFFAKVNRTVLKISAALQVPVCQQLWPTKLNSQSWRLATSEVNTQDHWQVWVWWKRWLYGTVIYSIKLGKKNSGWK